MPNNGADFTPTLDGYTGQQPLRFYCQKVLPLVYDDSLSYYEMLCKLLGQINALFEDVQQVKQALSEAVEAERRK